MSGKVFLPLWAAFTGLWLYSVLKVASFILWKMGR